MGTDSDVVLRTVGLTAVEVRCVGDVRVLKREHHTTPKHTHTAPALDLDRRQHAGPQHDCRLVLSRSRALVLSCGVA